MTTPPDRRRSLLTGGGSIAIAMAIMNVATYAFTMVAARLLGPQAYGAFASLMATLLVVATLGLGLQATAARRIAAEPEHVAQIERSILGVTYRVALSIGVLLLALAPLLNAILRLDSLATAALISVSAVPLTVMGGQAGILQGERRWLPLAVIYLLSGVPRLVIGVALIAWHPTESAAMLGTAIGACAPVLAGWWFLRGGRDSAASSEDHRLRPVIRETFHNSHVLLAFYFLSNIDIVIARNILPGHDAGLYAGGLILTKAVLFLPQFVVVVAFPSMSTSSERRRALTLSLALVSTLGAAVILVSAVLPQLVLAFVGGDQFQELSDHLWVFAVLGTILSMLQLLIYSVLARQGQRAVYLVWASCLAVIGLGLMANSLSGLLTIVIVVDGVLLAILLVVSLRVTRSVPETEAALG